MNLVSGFWNNIRKMSNSKISPQVQNNIFELSGKESSPQLQNSCSESKKICEKILTCFLVVLIVLFLTSSILILTFHIFELFSLPSSYGKVTNQNSSHLFVDLPYKKDVKVKILKNLIKPEVYPLTTIQEILPSGFFKNSLTLDKTRLGNGSYIKIFQKGTSFYVGNYCELSGIDVEKKLVLYTCNEVINSLIYYIVNVYFMYVLICLITVSFSLGVMVFIALIVEVLLLMVDL